jgi:transglutaminase-like putative cysteine protease
MFERIGRFQERHLSQRHFRRLALVLLAVGLPAAAIAQEDQPFRRWYTYDYVVRTSELVDVTSRTEVEVIAPSMVQSLGQHRMTVNTHFFELEIVEAATIKPDGRRIDVPRDKVVELNGTESSTNMLFQADVKTLVVPFPDLAAGDRTVLVTRAIQKRAQVAGGLSRTLAFAPSLRSEAMITVDAPRDIKLHVTERALTHTREERGDRIVVRWTIPRQSYAAEEAGSVAVIDWAPMLAFSTYESWEAIGSQAFLLADPKSKPTEEIDKLAGEITRGIVDKRQQAAAIYDWVARNIRYFLVVLGQGGWEPHDTASILANRYGDCKDHSTLMRALLRSKGIDSQFVLINSQNRIYKPFDVPIVGFDHMILYLPEFDLYADPTVATGSFHALPGVLADKPVVRVGSSGTTLGRTPVLKPEQNSIELTVEAEVKADGTIVGRNTVVAKGAAAIEARGMMRQFEQRGASEAVKLLLTRQRWAGSSTFETRSPFDRADPYEVKSNFIFTSMVSRLNTTAVVVPSGL